MESKSNNINSVFYADSYHPIQAGSIDGTDILPHDNAVYRAFLCSSAGLYDPTGDPKVIGDPYCTVFVGHLSPHTGEESLRKAMSKYGRVKNLRLVRHIVTGASRGYAFVEFETEREMWHAYEDAHHSIIDDSEIIVDYSRQQLMPGWIPRRLGGGLGGRKESGQLRFGGRERPFRAPLRPIPYDELKRLGIPLPPEGRYMSRFQIPPIPRRSPIEERSHKHSAVDGAEPSSRRALDDAAEKSSSNSHRHGQSSKQSKRRRDWDEERQRDGNYMDDGSSDDYKRAQERRSTSSHYQHHGKHSHRRERRSKSVDNQPP
ncbi:hypothetical protein AMTRI_Chr08g166200 [Amborella trichopoda]|uniref:RRM domain-containing protein n=1 Tax=Amborella trichopoda TaxID=13333 RepID=W1PMS2_AMBTC|nr:U11/U12 small nuclear ribonucleoprotein 35 kDa protein [Amborella trichopoda]ERN09006.1 hypothetical protein AMTR_s00153p00074100 [Amborella trichopoda]|eukprot:XP_006847425.1 U11/U12 small nuclear ribonucleoprotein 35 kDa protein [Amborella trichopoda]